MGEGFQFIDIILFAMIAAFLILRLRSVLGRHKDDGRAPKNPFSADKSAPPAEDNVVQLPDQSAPNEGVHFDQIIGDDPENEPLSPALVGFLEIAKIDPSFDPQEFIGGSRAAFELIIEAFAQGDRESLNSLLSDEVYNNFTSAIDAREEKEEVLENTLIRLVSAEPIEAYLEDTNAFITVKIISEQVNVTLNAKGEAVDGNSNQISEITDIWTFSRDLHSRNPNWKLAATRSLD
ncbi:MAG: Tim44 domain-containing protein [Rhodospirillales bacterium]|nr:Tim44 domain-containing protein [Rhodospirillales bacterium]